MQFIGRPSDRALLMVVGLLLLTAPLTWMGRSTTSGSAQPGLPPLSMGVAVDPNHADAATLSLLPGVGPATAWKIIDDRESQGPFRNPDDLQRVPGIGPKKVEQMKPWLQINDIPKERDSDAQPQ